MKKIIILTISVIGILFAGCQKDPEIPGPPMVKFKANTTIKSLKDSLQGTLYLIKDNIIIKGWVNSNDKTGNFYKQINIQDKTAGINIQIDSKDLYAKYGIGQEVFIKCKGLYLGYFRGIIQLGYDDNGIPGRIPEALINDHIFLNGYPNPANVPAPKNIILGEDNSAYYSMVVEIKDVFFDQAVRGFTWATKTAAQSRGFSDGYENGIVRTSNEATFALDVIPSDTGIVRGIWSTYDATEQLAFRSLEDLIGFKKYEKFIFAESFGSNQGAFTVKNELGTNGWKFDSRFGMMVDGKIKGDNIAWLISPKIDLSKVNEAYINFEHAINFAGANKVAYHTVQVTDDGGVTWTEAPIVNYPPGNNWDYIGSGAIAIPEKFIGKNNVQFAFRYQSIRTESSTWEVRNVTVKPWK